MSLAAGDRLGPYEILAPLGQGGMGEVYRARDPRLGREVAIKVLRGDRLTDERRRRRFVQEARAASALNHPHIVTIHEVDSADGIDFIVMEYVPGQPLDEVIPRKGMPVAEALRLAVPIAEALVAAHGRGIVHRDLKPKNLVVSREGVVKVLDFGLAKLVSDDADEGGETQTAWSDSGPLSRPGAITGTAGYMSPEQATGGKADARSDIFSFGAVLYEMVTGQRAFAGRSVSETLAAVMRDEPKPPRELAPAIPDPLERVILRCLRKEPNRRFQHMVDVKVELQELREEADPRALADAASRGLRKRPAWIVTGLTAALATLALAAWLWRSRPAVLPPPRVVPLTALPGLEAFASFSPDGQQVAFGWNGDKGDNPDIYVKIVGASELHRLTTDPSVDMRPSWSPDGRQIAFVRIASLRSPSSSIHLVSPLGGPDRRVGDWAVPSELASGAPLAWSPDSRFLVTGRAVSPGDTTPEAFGLFLIPIEGGDARSLTLPKPEGRDFGPAFSPDGRRLAYVSCAIRHGYACDISVIDLGPGFAPAGPPRRLTRQPVYRINRIAWLPHGQSVVYDTEPGPDTFYLWRVLTDGSRPPERIELAGLGARFPAVSGDRLAFTRSLIDQDIVRFAPDSNPEVFAGSSFADSQASFSPDGRRVAFESMRSGERMEIWLATAEGGNPEQLTRGPGLSQGSPAWSPDGRRIAFDSQGEDGRWSIWTIDVGGGTPRRLTRGNVPSWSRDGRWIYFGVQGDGRDGIWKVSPEGGTEERVVDMGVGSVGVAQESADGQSLLFATNEPPFPLLARPLSGGPDRTLARGVFAFRGFAVGERSLHYMTPGGGSGPPRPPGVRATLHKVDLASGKDTVLGTVETVRGGNLCVSPDERTILYPTFTSTGADLMLIEGFR